MRKFLATLLLALLLPSVAHAQAPVTQQNRAAINAAINNSFPTNGQGFITAAILRQFLDNFTASITAIFGDANVVPNTMLAQAPGETVKANVTGGPANIVDVPLASFFGSAPNNSIPASAIFGQLGPGGSTQLFMPAGGSFSFTATTTSSRHALNSPATNSTVVVYNLDIVPIFVAFGDVTAVATTLDDVVQPGSWVAFDAGPQTYIAMITATGSALGNVTSGTGLPAGSGGGSSGGVLGTVTLGAGTAAIGSLTAGSAVIGHVINDASSAVIGHVIADTGSTTAVTALPALPTGTNVIGHVIADVGSTTAVNSMPPLAAGTAVIGHVIADTGSTTAVTSLPAIPSGTNVIGHVICDSGCSGVSAIDGATFTGGVSSFVPNGGTYNSSIPALADGKQGTLALSSNRSLHTLDDNSASMATSLTGILTGVTSSVPTGTNSIGTVGLNTGSNVVGTVNTVSTNGGNGVPHVCGSHVFKHITTATDTQIVAASGSTTIYICDYSFSFNGTGNAYLEKATSGTCATLTQIDQTWYGAANVGKIAANPYYQGLNTGASAQLCVNTSQAISFDISVNYDQY